MLTQSDSMRNEVDWHNASVPMEFNLVWLGKRHDRLNKRAIASVKKCQPRANIHLWIDVFSMVDDEKLRAILGDELWTEYQNIQPDRMSQSPRAAIPAPGKTLKNVFETFRNVQNTFSAKLKTERSEVLMDNMHVAYFKDFCHKRNITLHYLDLECYPRWLAANNSNSSERDFALWTLFERYTRGGNFGAASDLLRIQLLIERPGIYIDHDDELTRPFAGQPCGFVYSKLTTVGDVLTDVVCNSFMGSCAGHPFLPAFRAYVLDSYARLARRGFVSHLSKERVNYTTFRPTQETRSTRGLYQKETLYRSGSMAMQHLLTVGPLAERLSSTLAQGYMKNVQVNSDKTWF